MGKRSKGLDAVRERNRLKKGMLSSCKKYAEQLEKENYELKNDPNTVIGAFIGQFRELYSQNQRLSVLGASLINKLGDKVVLTKEEMEAFKDKRINIKWEIADGETVETAKEFVFSYELQDAPPQGQPVQATEQPGLEPVEIADGIVASNSLIDVVPDGEMSPLVEEPEAALLHDGVEELPPVDGEQADGWGEDGGIPMRGLPTLESEINDVTDGEISPSAEEPLPQ
jgi:hypothetical protein